MKPDVKKRLIWSPVGGLAIPIAYYLLLFILYYIFRPIMAPAVEWLAMPLIWPAYLYDFLAPKLAEPVSFEMPGTGFWLYIATANFLFYSLLTYLLIRRRQRMPRLR